jgi:hypothetical protein
MLFICKNQDIRAKKMSIILNSLRPYNVQEVLNILKFLPQKTSILLIKFINRTIHQMNIKQELLTNYKLNIYVNNGIKKRGIIKGSNGNYFKTKARLSNLYLDLIEINKK